MGPRGERPAQVEVATFVADTALAEMLGRGSIEVLSSANEIDAGPVFEAAIVDRLIAAGYDTATPHGQSAQITELRIVRSELPSDSRPRKPVSGELSVGLGNRGSAAGLAVTIDLSKPPGPLITTRLEARIKDRASNELLWEGRAQIVTREEDPRWTSEHIATELTKALFDKFPSAV